MGVRAVYFFVLFLQGHPYAREICFVGLHEQLSKTSGTWCHARFIITVHKQCRFICHAVVFASIKQ